MGYTTYFKGKFKFNEPINDELKIYLNRFAGTRHMIRDNDLIKKYHPDWAENCFNGSLGEHGEYYLDDQHDFFATTTADKSIMDRNRPAETIPSLYCQWVVSEDGKYLKWDETEKFYNYADWLVYLLDNFIKPSGYVLSGEVTWVGENYDDRGLLKIVDNVLEIYDAKITYEKRD